MDEPAKQILVAARREIGCWSAPDADLSEALSALWPQLQRGFSMIPARPCDALPHWRSSFLAIKDDGAEECARALGRRQLRSDVPAKVVGSKLVASRL